VLDRFCRARTHAVAAQQREANNINQSLTTMWRCLNSMKTKDNTGIIPFRDSKLTHLLMPQLCRAGASCVSMIACINPQVDDYDETISVLSNASLASRIKEIADLGRVAAIPLCVQNTVKFSDADEDSQAQTEAPAPAHSQPAAHTTRGGRMYARSSTLGADGPTTVATRVAAIEKSSAKKRKHDSIQASGKPSRKNSTVVIPDGRFVFRMN
jgi:hypothetical protein